MKKMLLPALAVIALICGSTWLFINKDKPMNDLTQTDPELAELTLSAKKFIRTATSMPKHDICSSWRLMSQHSHLKNSG